MGTSVDARRRLPALGRLLSDPRAASLAGRYGHSVVVDALRTVLESLRHCPDTAGADPVGTAEGLLSERFGGRTGRVLNATGVLLHTNLGRAPLPRDLVHDVAETAAGYCDLELELEGNRRRERLRRVAGRLEALSGADASLVTNNAAAALVLAVAALARGRHVLVSRGELVEIGGNFRIPEILEAAGARLVEVGTTNRTRAEDYARAIGPDTAMLLRVFRSNFELQGFVEEPDLGELVELAGRAGVPLVVDEGSGLLTSSDHPALVGKPSVRELLGAGADLVIASGDKLLGGPQAGLLLGRTALIAECRNHPLYRALRPGKLILVALERILERRLAGGEGPVGALTPDAQAHLGRVLAFAGRVGAAVVSGEATLGGGAGSARSVPGPVLALAGGEDLATRLRLGTPAVVGYQRDGLVLLDLRTVEATDDSALGTAVLAAKGSPARTDPARRSR